MKTTRVIKAGGKHRTQYQRRMKILLFAFGALSLLVVPALTIYFGARGNPFQTSLSEIGNRDGMRLTFLIWTITVCAYFSTMVSTLVVLTKNTRARILQSMILVSTCLLMLTCLIPFMPENLPLLANLHTKVAVIATLLLAITLLLLTLTFRSYYPKLFSKALIAILILIAIMMILFIFYSSCWIMEGTSVIGGSVFLFLVLQWLYKEQDFDAQDVLSTYDLDVAQKEIKHLQKRTKEAYEEYLKLTSLSRIAQMELQELKKYTQKGF